LSRLPQRLEERQIFECMQGVVMDEEGNRALCRQLVQGPFDRLSQSGMRGFSTGFTVRPRPWPNCMFNDCASHQDGSSSGRRKYFVHEIYNGPTPVQRRL
jgi:hypothetical protein